MGLVLEWSSELDQEIPVGWIDKLNMILQKAGESEGIQDGEVGLTFVDNEQIRKINKQYRGIDKATDVLSFALNEHSAEEPEVHYQLLGDIVISVPKAEEQSEEYGHSIEREIGFLFVHGFLHLLGYDHDDEEAEKEMFAKQERILLEVGLTR